MNEIIFNSTFITSPGKHLAYLFFNIVGIGLHELSHAIAAKVFNHRVNKISFFSPKKNSITEGYVEHSYNKHSFYQLSGMLFIGFDGLNT